MKRTNGYWQVRLGGVWVPCGTIHDGIMALIEWRRITKRK